MYQLTVSPLSLGVRPGLSAEVLAKLTHTSSTAALTQICPDLIDIYSVNRSHGAGCLPCTCTLCHHASFDKIESLTGRARYIREDFAARKPVLELYYAGLCIRESPDCRRLRARPRCPGPLKERMSWYRSWEGSEGESEDY